MTQEPRYPRRDRFFAHRVCRLLAKTCAAQEIGPVATLLVTFVAHQEDACQYRRPVTYWDAQLLPLLGIDSKSTLSKVRKKAVEAGWLHYVHGSRGNVGKYWCMIPSHAHGVSDLPIDHDDESIDSDSIQNMDRIRIESESNRNRTGIDVESERNRKVPPFLPQAKAQAISPPEDEFEFSNDGSFAVAHGIDWTTVEAEFAAAWNATANTSKCRSGIAYDLVQKFRELWLTPGWKEDAAVAMAKIPESTLGAISMKQFLTPSFFESLHGGTYGPKAKRGAKAASAAKPETKPEAPPPTVLERVTVPLLQRTPELVAWFHDAAEIGITDGTENSRHNVVAAATRALKPDVRDPVAWFISCVTSRAWDRIGDEADEVARKRLKDFDAGKRAKNVAPEIAAKLAEVAAKRSTAELTPAQLLVYGDGEEDAA